GCAAHAQARSANSELVRACRMSPGRAYAHPGLVVLLHRGPPHEHALRTCLVHALHTGHERAHVRAPVQCSGCTMDPRVHNANVDLRTDHHCPHALHVHMCTTRHTYGMCRHTCCDLPLRSHKI
ncbi:hypothetical protein AMTR_s00005p00261950, partial [Amborella trichopoda]